MLNDTVLVWAGRTTVWSPREAALTGRKLLYSCRAMPKWSLSIIIGDTSPPDAVYEHMLRREIDGSRILLITRAEQLPELGPAYRPYRVLSATLWNDPNVDADKDVDMSRFINVDVSGFINERVESFVIHSDPAYGSLTVSDLAAVLLARGALKAPGAPKVQPQPHAHGMWSLRIILHDLSELCLHDEERIAW